MAREFNILTTGRRVYDPDFQASLSQSVEYGRLRGTDHIFNTRQAWNPTSFTVYGALPPKGGPRKPDGTFIAIEAHDRGAVSVYFEERRTRPVSQILTRWVLGAVEAALLGHEMLGSAGLADITLLLDGSGIADPDPQWARFRRSAPHDDAVPIWVDGNYGPLIYDYLVDVPLRRQRPADNLIDGNQIDVCVMKQWQQRWLNDPKRLSPTSLSKNLDRF